MPQAVKRAKKQRKNGYGALQLVRLQRRGTVRISVESSPRRSPRFLLRKKCKNFSKIDEKVLKKDCELSIIRNEKEGVKKRVKYIRKRRIRIMDYKLQQQKMDDIKWYDSIVAGEDRCGSYEFCAKCKKESKYH